MLTEAKNQLAVPSPIIVRQAERGGWAIFDASVRGEPSLLHCCSDDEALLEYFADALSLPAPDLLGPTPQPRADEAPAAAIVPPPVLEESLSNRMLKEAEVQLRAQCVELVDRLDKLRELLRPFARLAIAWRDEADDSFVAFHEFTVDPGKGIETLDFDMVHVRALLRAAGLFTDDMRPSQPPAADASVKPAEVAATPPPADAEEEEPEYERAPYAHNATNREDPF